MLKAFILALLITPFVSNASILVEHIPETVCHALTRLNQDLNENTQSAKNVAPKESASDGPFPEFYTRLRGPALKTALQTLHSLQAQSHTYVVRHLITLLEMQITNLGLPSRKARLEYAISMTELGAWLFNGHQVFKEKGALHSLKQGDFLFGLRNAKANELKDFVANPGDLDLIARAVKFPLAGSTPSTK